MVPYTITTKELCNCNLVLGRCPVKCTERVHFIGAHSTRSHLKDYIAVYSDRVVLLAFVKQGSIATCIKQSMHYLDLNRNW